MYLSLCLLLSACGEDDDATTRSISGTSAYGAPLANAVVTIATDTEWAEIGTTDENGEFSGALSEDAILPSLIRAVKSREAQLEELGIEPNSEAAQEVQTITYFGVINDEEQDAVNATPWTTAVIANALGVHPGSLSLEEVNDLTETNYQVIERRSNLFSSLLRNYLDAVGLPEDYNPFTTAFEIGDALDVLLDLINFELSSDGEVSGMIRVTGQHFEFEETNTNQPALLLPPTPIFDEDTGTSRYPVEEITELFERVNDFFDSNPDIGVSDLFHAEYLDNGTDYDTVSNGLTSFRDGNPDDENAPASRASFHAPRINFCDTEEDVCNIELLMSFSQGDYSSVRRDNWFVKFPSSDDPEGTPALFYGNQSDIALRVRPYLMFEQELDPSDATAPETEPNTIGHFIGYKISIGTHGIYDAGFSGHSPSIEAVTELAAQGSYNPWDRAVLSLRERGSSALPGDADGDPSNDNDLLGISAELICSSSYTYDEDSATYVPNPSSLCTDARLHSADTFTNFTGLTSDERSNLQNLLASPTGIELLVQTTDIQESDRTGEYRIPITSLPPRYEAFQGDDAIELPSISEEDMIALRDYDGTEAITITLRATTDYRFDAAFVYIPTGDSQGTSSAPYFGSVFASNESVIEIEIPARDNLRTDYGHKGKLNIFGYVGTTEMEWEITIGN